MRELGVSAYRTVAGRRGISMPARQLGKVKTVFQLVAVGVALCPPPPACRGLALTMLWVAVALTVVSGLDIVLRPVAERGGDATAVRCEVLAVGTELLLGQIVDTNSAWIGEQLAAAGIDCYLHVQVGDNQARDRASAALRCSTQPTP